ncbi:MAG TPA: DUF4352 domain-containing protein [Actinomycetota bacterium]|nr:DUF4352 domain-containing protein [Actinomycetota bacterium]
MNPRLLATVILLTVAAAVVVALILTDGGDTAGRDEGGGGEQVTFDVLDGECGYKSVVTAERSIAPEQGEFCLVRVNITNPGTEPARLDPSCQFFVAATGERFAPRPDVLGLDPASSQAFQTPIGPGQLVEDVGLYYDVPAGTKPGSAQLHGVCGENPVKVPL